MKTIYIIILFQCILTAACLGQNTATSKFSQKSSFHIETPISMIKTWEGIDSIQFNPLKKAVLYGSVLNSTNQLDREKGDLVLSKDKYNMPIHVPQMNDAMPIVPFRDDKNYTLLIKDLQKTQIDPSTEPEKNKAR